MLRWVQLKQNVPLVMAFVLLLAFFSYGCTGDYVDEIDQYELEEEFPQDDGWEDPGGEEEPLF